MLRPTPYPCAGPPQAASCLELVSRCDGGEDDSGGDVDHSRRRGLDRAPRTSDRVDRHRLRRSSLCCVHGVHTPRRKHRSARLARSRARCCAHLASTTSRAVRRAHRALGSVGLVVRENGIPVDGFERRPRFYDSLAVYVNSLPGGVQRVEVVPTETYREADELGVRACAARRRWQARGSR